MKKYLNGILKKQCILIQFNYTLFEWYFIQYFIANKTTLFLAVEMMDINIIKLLLSHENIDVSIPNILKF